MKPRKIVSSKHLSLICSPFRQPRLLHSSASEKRGLASNCCGFTWRSLQAARGIVHQSLQTWNKKWVQEGYKSPGEQVFVFEVFRQLMRDCKALLPSSQSLLLDEILKVNSSQSFSRRRQDLASLILISSLSEDSQGWMIENGRVPEIFGKRIFNCAKPGPGGK